MSESTRATEMAPLCPVTECGRPLGHDGECAANLDGRAEAIRRLTELEESGALDDPRPTAHNHGTAACGRSCPTYGDMLMEKTAARFNTTRHQNDRGEWVPAIPLPLFVGFRLRKCRCECGQTFPNKLRYREHFALAHILGLSC